MERAVNSATSILIVNAHSARNLGDAAILQATLQQLSGAFPNAAITLAANDPESWQEFDGLTVVPSLCSWAADCRQGDFRRRLWQVPFVLLWLVLASVLYRLGRWKLLWGNGQKRCLLAAYYEADMVLSCGGGNLYAHHSPSPAFFWALMAPGFALALDKPVYLLPQSVGPITGQRQRAFARFVLNRVRRLMVRESISLAFCQQELNLRSPLHLFPDLAFGLESGLLPARPGQPIQVGVTVIDRAAQNPRFQKQDAYEAAVEQALATLHREHDAQITIFVQCFGPSPDQDDRLAAQRLAGKLADAGIPAVLADEFVDPRFLQKAYAQMDIVIATRMHSAILALGAGTPAVVISYQPKARGMMADFDLGAYEVDISEVTARKLADMAAELLEAGESLRIRTLERTALLRQQLASWVYLLDG